MADYALGTDDGSRKRVLLPSADEPVKWFGSPVFLNGVSREESALSTAASGFVARAARRRGGSSRARSSPGGAEGITSVAVNTTWC